MCVCVCVCVCVYVCTCVYMCVCVCVARAVDDCRQRNTPCRDAQWGRRADWTSTVDQFESQRQGVVIETYVFEKDRENQSVCCHTDEAK